MIGRALAAAVLVLALQPAAGALAEEGYLRGAPLAYAVPPPPASGTEVARMDLVMVRALQSAPAEREWQEANGDARAYNADVVIRRFEDAWGDSLAPEKRPILVHVLARVIQDTSAYAAAAKAGNHRDRPYVGHPDIAPCDRGPPAHQIKDNESYPSGHAMNGYVVGALLADLNPQRETALVARGVRYGQNRVVCGVHHPIDVAQGRLLGIAYLDAVRVDPGFKTEFACAREEQANLADPAVPVSAPCRALVAPAAAPKALKAPHAPAPAAKPNPVDQLF